MLELRKNIASVILSKYNQTLIPEWKGVLPMWHVWHSPYKVWLITYDEYLNRITEIEENKPENEKALRFSLMKPVQGNIEGKELEECKIAYNVIEKSEQVIGMADNEETRQGAYILLNAAIDGFNYSLEELDGTAQVKKLHKKECPNSTWKERTKRLTF